MIEIYKTKKLHKDCVEYNNKSYILYYTNLKILLNYNHDPKIITILNSNIISTCL